MPDKKRIFLWKLLLNARSMHPRWLSCGECFALVSHFADLLAAGESPKEIEERARDHLRYCPDCHEHYQRHIDDLVEQYSNEK